MSEEARQLARPGRWDEPFDREMSEADVERVLDLEPFASMDEEAFPRSTPLRGILANDTAIRRYRDGQIVVRDGDYGTSAFLVLSGRVSVVIAPGLPPEVLGRARPARRGVWSALSQWWGNSAWPEVRAEPSARFAQGVVAREGAGETEVFLQDVPGVLASQSTAVLSPGQFFGEISALGRVPRTATIFAYGDAELLEIRWQGLRDLQRSSPALARHIEAIYRERFEEAQLRATPELRNVADADIGRLTEATEFEFHGEFEWHGTYKSLIERSAADRLGSEPVIAAEGHYPNGLIVLAMGFGRVSVGEGAGFRTDSYLGKGHVFGLPELLHNWKHPERPVAYQRSLRAVGHAQVLVIPTALVEELILPVLPPELVPPPIETTGPGGGPPTTALDRRGDVLEFLLSRRLVNGTQAMVIDLQRCTSCDDCIRACASTHDGNPRFVRSGPRFGSTMVAGSCMHCVDPVCMIGCPTGAIHRSAGGGEVVINQTTCVGCQTCARSCPYDNIRMVPVRRPDGRPWEIAQTREPVLKATKCDLCSEQLGGPACQRACPHDALERVDLSEAANLKGRFGE